jgi:hypothetical protein
MRLSQKQNIINNYKGWRCGSIGWDLPSTQEAKGSILSIEEEGEEEGGRRRKE